MNYISSNVEFVGPTSDSNTRSVSYARTQFETLGPTVKFYKENPVIGVVPLVITLLGTVLSSFFHGIFGSAIRIYIYIAIYLLTPDIVNKVRKITKG